MTLLTPMSFYSGAPLKIYQLLILLHAVTGLFHMFRKAFQKNKAMLYSLLGFVPFLATIFNDILGGELPLFPYGFAFFILAQSYTLSKIFSDAFIRAEYLSENLQIEVHNQTVELLERGNELKLKSQKMEEQKNKSAFKK